jgi:hypothetical protein
MARVAISRARRENSLPVAGAPFQPPDATVVQPRASSRPNLEFDLRSCAASCRTVSADASYSLRGQGVAWG